MTKAAFTGREKRPDEISLKGMAQGGLRALLYFCLLLGIIVAVGQAFAGGIVEEPSYTPPPVSEYR